VRGPELLEPVDVVRAGALVEHAIGWSRTPLQTIDLSSMRARHKRWEHWAVMTDELLFLLTLVDLGPLSLAIVGCCDLATGAWMETARPLRRLELPDRVHAADIHVRTLGLSATITAPSVSEGVLNLTVRARTLSGPIEADLTIAPGARDTLNVLVPWSRDRFAFTSKQPGLAARGRVRARREYTVNGVATLDHGRGVWPRDTRWNWASASDARVAFNLGAQWTDGSGTNENGVWVDGKLRSLSEDVRFDLDRGIVGPTVDLAFVPLHRKRVNVGVLELDFRIGHFTGTIGEARFDNVLGWAEAFRARW